jgi:hypothetical protein
MGTKNKPGAFDCYANAEPDEPMFVLLGRDKHAPALVWLWAALRELDGEKPEKVAEARDCCQAMMAWIAEKGKASVGVGQAVLAGVLELIRTANHATKHLSPKNIATREEFMRVLMNFTNMGAEPVSLADAMATEATPEN